MAFIPVLLLSEELKNIAQCQSCEQFAAQSSDLLVNDQYSSLRFNEKAEQPVKDVH